MTLQIKPLIKAYGQLTTSLEYLYSPMAANDAGLRRQFRNSVIQCFEFTYELSYKMIRRQLSVILPAPSTIKEMNYADLMRSAAEAGLIQDVKRFLEYREMRNLTSHTYDENKAEQILTHMTHFAKDVEQLILELKKRNA